MTLSNRSKRILKQTILNILQKQERQISSKYIFLSLKEKKKEKLPLIGLSPQRVTQFLVQLRNEDKVSYDPTERVGLWSIKE